MLRPAEQRRCHVELQLQVAFELLLQLLLERAVGVQARHLVLVLVGHQLEQAGRRRAGEGQRGITAQRRFAFTQLAHPRLETAGVSRVLVGGEVGHAAGQQRIQRLGLGRRGIHRRLQQRLQGAFIGRGHAAQRKRQLVGLHRHAVQLDRALQRGQAHRNQPALPGIPHRQDVADDGVAQESLGQSLRLEGLHLLHAGRELQLGQQQVGLQAGVGVLQRFGHRNLVRVDQHPRAAVAHRLQRLGRCGHHDVAGQHRVGLLGVDAHLVQPLGRVGQAHEAQHRAALLRKAHEVEHAGALAFQVRGHRDHRAHRHHAGAAHAGHQQVVRAGPYMRRGLRQLRHLLHEALGACAGQRTGLLAGLAIQHAHEAGAKALGAGIVLVAAALVDAPLAAQRCLVRQHRHAVALHRAIAAAFAHPFVDEEPARRVHHLALLAAAALLGGAGLLVDQHGDARHFAQAALHRIELAAVVELGAGRKAVLDRRVLADVVGQHHHLLDAFAFHLTGDGIDADHAVHRLAAGHGHRVVEQDLVGERGLGRHRLADGEVARMVVGAVAQVLEHMRHLGEHRVRDPVHALAAHLDQARGVAVHPVGHEVAADAGAGAGAFGHHGGGVVRAAGAEIRQPLDAVGVVGQQPRRHEVAHQVALVHRRLAREVPHQPLVHQLDQA